MQSAKHILVIEDEMHLAVGIKYNLEAEGYRVTTVDDGASALRLVEKQADDIDLVILDLMLPGMSGYAVCESLREAGLMMPVLILSARTLVEDRTRGFDVGANQYLSKPFELDELLSRVKNLLSMHSQRAKQPAKACPGVFRLGDVQVDFDSFEVTKEQKRVRMTPLEIKLLRFFVTNPNRVIPRHELLENVWDMPGHLHTRAPDQFIRRLRKLFEVNPAEPQYFLTIRDAGYRFVPPAQDAEMTKD